MDQAQKYKKWLINWQPKHVNVNFKKHQWQESTLNQYVDVLTNIVEDLKIDDQSMKSNLLDYHDAKSFSIIYKKLINHQNFKSLKNYPIATKSLKRYLDFLYDQRI